MIRDVGDTQAVRYLARVADGTLTDATVVLTVTDPAGVDTTPAVTHTSVGTYDASFLLDQTGGWFWQWEASGAVVDVAYGEVEVADPAPPTYVTLAELKEACGPITDSTRDNLLLRALSGASRGIDEDCGFPRRRFYRDAAPSARSWLTCERETWEHKGRFWLLTTDDIATTAGMVVEVGDGTTWTAVTDYTVEPDNATATFKAVTGLRRFVTGWGPSRYVRVTAAWGWPSVPDTIAEATLLQASRLFARRNSPEGVAGNAEWGISRVSRLDPDVRRMIGNYRLDGFA